jgi:hypothetical protein
MGILSLDIWLCGGGVGMDRLSQNKIKQAHGWIGGLQWCWNTRPTDGLVDSSCDWLTISRVRLGWYKRLTIHVLGWALFLLRSFTAALCRSVVNRDTMQQWIKVDNFPENGHFLLCRDEMSQHFVQIIYKQIFTAQGLKYYWVKCSFVV